MIQEATTELEARYYVNEYTSTGKLVHTFGGYLDKEAAERSAAGWRRDPNLSTDSSVRVETNRRHWKDAAGEREAANYNIQRRR